MSHLLLLLLFALAAACAPARTGAAPVAADLALTHVTVVDVESGRSLPDQTVLIRGNRIVQVAPAGRTRIPAGAAAIDARGKYVIPGLWDMHVHLEHFPDSDLLELFLAHGVTTVRNMDGRPHILEWKRQVGQGELLGPRIYTAGPILDGDPPLQEDNTVVRSAAEARSAVLDQAAQGYDFIKVYSNLSEEAYRAVLQAAEEQGLAVAGHVPRSVSVDEALSAGQRSIEHLADYGRLVEAEDSPFRNRFHWSTLYFAMPVDSAAVERTAQRVAEAGVWTIPTLVQASRAVAPPDTVRAWLAAPEMAHVPGEAHTLWEAQLRRTSARMDAGDWQIVERGRENRRRMVRSLHRAGAGLLIGTDTPNPFVIPGYSVHEELNHFVEAGLPPARALRAATSEAARFLGADSLGTVAAGQVADLVLLDADPLKEIRNTRAISAVVLNGRYLARAGLLDLLTEAQPAARP